MSKWTMLRLALGFAALLHVDAFVVCREREVAFYHVPKCAGLSITDALLATGGYMLLSMSSPVVRDRMDRCHTTPSEVQRFSSRDGDADFRAIDVEGVQRRRRSFLYSHRQSRARSDDPHALSQVPLLLEREAPIHSRPRLLRPAHDDRAAGQAWRRGSASRLRPLLAVRATGLPAHAPPDEDCPRSVEVALGYPRLST